jgi:hypothetical protein
MLTPHEAQRTPLVVVLLILLVIPLAGRPGPLRAQSADQEPDQGEDPNWFQSVETWVEDHGRFTPTLKFEVWPRAHRNYQHQYQVDLRAGLRARGWAARGYLRGNFWQTDASKIVGSPVNAENNMNWHILYGGSLVYHLGAAPVYLGATIHRDEQHVVWRFKTQNGYRNGYGSFEGYNSWQDRETRCRNGMGCGSISYAEQAGAVVGVEAAAVSASVRWLPYRYKDLTRVPVPWIVRAEARGLPRITVAARAARDLAERWRYSVAVRARVLGPFRVQVRRARVQPDQKRSFAFWGLGLLYQ